MTVGFKPLCGLFSQFKYLLLKYMGNLTIELELVNNQPLICVQAPGVAKNPAPGCGCDALAGRLSAFSFVPSIWSIELGNTMTTL